MAQRRHIVWIDPSPGEPQPAPIETARLETTRVVDLAELNEVEHARFHAVFLVARSPDEALAGLRELGRTPLALPVGVVASLSLRARSSAKPHALAAHARCSRPYARRRRSAA